MNIISWIQGHQMLVGAVMIGVFVAGTGIGIFFLLRKAKGKIKATPQKFLSALEMKSQTSSAIDVPPIPSVDYQEKVIPSQEEVDKEEVDKVLHAPIVTFKGGTKKMVRKKKDVVVEKPSQLVDINQLTVEQLEQLLKEKKELSVVEQKRQKLMVMEKEELVELIIDNQLEI